MAKITKSYLKQIIKEELSKLSEVEQPKYGAGSVADTSLLMPKGSTAGGWDNYEDRGTPAKVKDPLGLGSGGVGARVTIKATKKSDGQKDQFTNVLFKWFMNGTYTLEKDGQLIKFTPKNYTDIQVTPA